MTNALLIYNSRLLDENIDSPGAVLSVEGKIRAIFQGYYTNSETLSNMAYAILNEDGYTGDCKLDLYDASGLTLTPAFIDMHVHLRYPGFPQKEDLESGLNAAAAGGFGTICAMPNTNPVVSSLELALQIEKEATDFEKSNLLQIVSITENFDGKTTSHLDVLDNVHVPVISEDGHEVESSKVMLEAMEKAAEKNIIVACHCEDPALAAEAKIYRDKALKLMKEFDIPSWGVFSDYSDNTPESVSKQITINLCEANELLRIAEDTCTERNLLLAKKANCHIHICHVSTEKSLEYIRTSKEKGQLVTCEVTPHHFALNANKWPEIRELVNPPIREQKDNDAIIKAINDGTIDCISTDHAPHTFSDKEKGSPGFTGLEISYAAANHFLVKKHNISEKKLSSLMSANPARILNLQKGLLQQNYDADFTLIDTEQTWTVQPKNFLSKGKATPFENMKLTGKVRALFVGGKLVMKN